MLPQHCVVVSSHFITNCDMSIYIREKLKDAYSSVGVSLEELIDIRFALEKLLRRGDIDRRELLLLRDYIYGHPITELEVNVPGARSIILRVLAALEVETRYFDSYVVSYGLSRYPSLRVIKEALHKKAQLLSHVLEE